MQQSSIRSPTRDTKRTNIHLEDQKELDKRLQARYKTNESKESHRSDKKSKEFHEEKEQKEYKSVPMNKTIQGTNFSFFKEKRNNSFQDREVMKFKQGN